MINSSSVWITGDHMVSIYLHRSADIRLTEEHRGGLQTSSFIEFGTPSHLKSKSQNLKLVCTSYWGMFRIRVVGSHLMLLLNGVVVRSTGTAHAVALVTLYQRAQTGLLQRLLE